MGRPLAMWAPDGRSAPYPVLSQQAKRLGVSFPYIYATRGHTGIALLFLLFWGTGHREAA